MDIVFHIFKVGFSEMFFLLKPWKLVIFLNSILHKSINSDTTIVYIR